MLCGETCGCSFPGVSLNTKKPAAHPSLPAFYNHFQSFLFSQPPSRVWGYVQPVAAQTCCVRLDVCVYFEEGSDTAAPRFGDLHMFVLTPPNPEFSGLLPATIQL